MRLPARIFAYARGGTWLVLSRNSFGQSSAGNTVLHHAAVLELERKNIYVPELCVYQDMRL